MKFFFDTNVLLYRIDTADPIKQRSARACFNHHAEAGNAVISTQVMQEFHYVLRARFASTVPAEDAFRMTEALTVLDVVQVTPQLVLIAARRSQHHRLSFWDALIVSAAAHAGCGTLITEGLSHGQVIDGVRVENPFLGDAA